MYTQRPWTIRQVGCGFIFCEERDMFREVELSMCILKIYILLQGDFHNLMCSRSMIMCTTEVEGKEIERDR